MEGVEDRHRRQREQYGQQRDRETEEQQVRLERRREYDRLPMPCTVTGADDALIPDTAMP